MSCATLARRFGEAWRVAAGSILGSADASAAAIVKQAPSLVVLWLKYLFNVPDDKMFIVLYLVA